MHSSTHPSASACKSGWMYVSEPLAWLVPSSAEHTELVYWTPYVAIYGVFTLPFGTVPYHEQMIFLYKYWPTPEPYLSCSMAAPKEGIMDCFLIGQNIHDIELRPLFLYCLCKRNNNNGDTNSQREADKVQALLSVWAENKLQSSFLRH